MFNGRRRGFSEITSIVFIALMAIVMALIIIVWVQNKRIEKRDTKIESLRQEKVGDAAKSENKVFEVEHKTIGKQIKPKEFHEEVNLSIGTHSIKFSK